MKITGTQRTQDIGCKTWKSPTRGKIQSTYIPIESDQSETSNI